MSEIIVKRTSREYSISASEFVAFFPDGTTETFWSPVWNEYTKEEEEKEAILHAKELWDNKLNENLAR